MLARMCCALGGTLCRAVLCCIPGGMWRAACARAVLCSDSKCVRVCVCVCCAVLYQRPRRFERSSYSLARPQGQGVSL